MLLDLSGLELCCRITDCRIEGPKGMIHPTLYSFQTGVGFLLSSSLWEAWVGSRPQHPGWLQRVLRWVVSPESLSLYASVSHTALIGISLL